MLEDGFEAGKRGNGGIHFGSSCGGLEGDEFGSSQGNESWEELCERGI